ncbi:MAG: CHAT domain-containing protein [Acidimicrobiales bacterium]
MSRFSRLLKMIGGVIVVGAIAAAVERVLHRRSASQWRAQRAYRIDVAEQESASSTAMGPVEELPAGAAPGAPAPFAPSPNPPPPAAPEAGAHLPLRRRSTSAIDWSRSRSWRTPADRQYRVTEPESDFLFPEPPDGDADQGAGADAAPDRVTRGRYANIILTDPDSGSLHRVPPPLEPGQRLGLLLDIGPRRAESAVYNPAPFPDDLLPRENLVIDIVVSSPHFIVAAQGAQSESENTQSAQMILPADGSPAYTATGEHVLGFVITAPSEPGLARARVTYYYADAAVQSHLIETDLGSGRPIEVRTDFTITSAPRDLEVITKRPRVSVLINGGGGSHQVLVRRPSIPAPAGAPEATTFDVPTAAAGTIRKLRANLASDAIAPTAVRLTRDQLIQTLRLTAPLGWDLYAAFLGIIRDELFELNQPDTVLNIVRPAGTGLSVPWAWLYSIPIDSQHERDAYANVPVCQLVAGWDGTSPLVDAQARSCPYANDPEHRKDVLCPFGFLGFQHMIEQLTNTRNPVFSIPLPATGTTMVVGETSGINAATLSMHIGNLRSALSAGGSGYTLKEGPDKATIKRLVTTDLPLLYFYCHGERPNSAAAETYLGVGNSEWIAAKDFNGWVLEAFQFEKRRVWDHVRPLVFINACHSAELDPDALFNYVDAFVGGGNAAGVVGTEVRVFSPLAMQFALTFYTALLESGVSVGEALRRARMEFLVEGNLFGLLYTPYCWADLKLEPPAA